ncbi:hypothetical protein K1719_023035 [Acacia pycnantha]|nr:hypothetical protein K1719_023035 [Acacia pycnantha]
MLNLSDVMNFGLNIDLKIYFYNIDLKMYFWGDIFIRISLLEKSGLLERALEELHKKESKIVDKLAYKEQEVSLLVKLGHLGEGEKLYRILLSMNPDNYR